MKKVIIFSIFLFLLSALPALAHQPRLVKSGQTVKIENPEISQAFYGELEDEPQWFEFQTDKKFLLYVNILLPKIPEAKKNISVEIYWNDRFIAWLDADNTKWSELHEPFGNDDYWQGRAYERQEDAGVYRLKVYSKDNKGKYALVIGKQEKFPPKEILNTILLLPALKADFFNKSPFTAYFNYVGLFLLGFLIILSAITILLIKILRRKKKNATAQKA